MNKTQCSFVLCFSTFILFASLTMAREQNGSYACLNEQGQPVSWWVIIKTPDTLNDYVYRDSNSQPCSHESTGSCWGPLHHDLSDLHAGALSTTMQQIYQPDANFLPGYIIYNDESYVGTSLVEHSEYAHAKGVVATSEAGGFWLVHSVPRFPKDEVGNTPYSGITPNGHTYAQSFLCISLAIDQMRTVGTQLRLAHPFVYQKGGFSSILLQILGSDFRAVLNEAEAPSNNEQSGVHTLYSTDGSPFLSLTKSRFWGEDFYDTLVSQVLNADLFVDSWNNGQGTLPPVHADTSCKDTHFSNLSNLCTALCTQNGRDCTFKHNIANVTDVRIDAVTSWPNHKDHSKWAVTAPSAQAHMVCLGDINRQEGQRARGGGTVCLANESLWETFQRMIGKSDR